MAVSTLSTNRDILAAESRVRADRMQIDRAISELRFVADDSLKPTLKMLGVFAGLYILARLARRWIY